MEEWDGFAYVPVGTAPDLAAAACWAHGLNSHDSTDQE
ncbi:hypothetical protein ACFH04_41920 [Streptomyces noboritoensis]|uniref:Uncharacterized protein n=1 Tax=Streptomyces noboritoensis TaxID=67337 RepID=A0ABV6TYH6_9ACTN